MQTKENNNIRVLDRAIDITEKIAASGDPISLSELVEQTGYSKSTIHRILSTLVDRHYVEKLPDARYIIGYKLIEVASINISNLELLTEARPFLVRMANDFNLAAHIGILDGMQVTYIGKKESSLGARQHTKIGSHSPAYCSPIGKVLLACLPGKELEKFLRTCKFEKFTENTISSAAEFREHLITIRAQGWADDDEEYEKGRRRISAPIYDYTGNAIAAFSVTGSTHTLTQENKWEVIEAVKDSALKISRKMGYID